MESTTGTILRLTKFSDSSVIVHWLTGSHGRIKTMAKGAFRPHSPFAGKIDLFFESDLVFQPARRGEIHHLREVSLRAPHSNLGKNYASFELASYFCQLIETALEPSHPDEPVYHLLQRGLRHLDSSTASLKALRHFENELARLLGIARQGTPGASVLTEILGALPPARTRLIERFSSA